MSNQVNEMILEQILDDVLVLAKDDICNVVDAIKDEFGIVNLPVVSNDEDRIINKLVELRVDALCALGG